MDGSYTRVCRKGNIRLSLTVILLYDFKYIVYFTHRLTFGSGPPDRFGLRFLLLIFRPAEQRSAWTLFCQALSQKRGASNGAEKKRGKKRERCTAK